MEHLLKDVLFNHYFFIGGLFLSYLSYRLLHSLLSDNNYTYTKHRSRQHTWRSIQCNRSIPFSIHCTVCEELMLPVVGLFCECCAVSACKRCHHIVNKRFRCKVISWPSERSFNHLWVNVGFTQNETHDEGMKRYFCSWCHRLKLCTDSVFNDSEQCDFQKYRKIIIPPTSVILNNGVISHIKPPPYDDWEPLIIFANRKSGSNRSDEVLSLFRGLLNPIQVVDMGSTPPESVVRWLPPRCRLLAGGGDGTVAWILNALRTVPDIKASVAILPMGTGNDLSRVLGWGATCDSHIDAPAIINDIRHAEEQLLDCWKITIKPIFGRLRRLRHERVIFAYNYASIGVDAQVALDFHYARRKLYQFSSRMFNYVTYVFLGAGRAFDGGCEGLERRLHVKADGEPLTIPPIQSLIALNIPSWGAGVDLWSMGSDADNVGEQSICDGKLEIAGISSSFHIARLQCGLAEPYRFAQATKVEIVLEGSCAMQVDGEPWMQGPAAITIEPAGHCLMLRASPESHD